MEVEEMIERLNSKRATREVIAKELRISSSTLTRKLKKLGYNYDQTTKLYSLTKSNPEAMEISNNPKKKEPKSESKQSAVRISTPKNNDFTEEEVRVLKLLIDEHQNDYKMFSEYRIYDELSKVPIGAEQVRSAFNISKETTERLKKYANERRLPLQDIVELAVINLLDQYEKK